MMHYHHNMSLENKAKIISIIVLILLIIPAFLVPIASGMVLGVSTKNQQISEGVNTSINISKEEPGIYLSIIAILNDKQINSIESDKFPVGTNLEIVSQGETYQGKVEAIRQLKESEYLSLNMETYKMFGGNIKFKSPITLQIKY